MAIPVTPIVRDEGHFVPPAPAERSRNGVLLPIASIDTSGRRRAVNPAAVAQLADSIAAQGLITPILVRPVSDEAYALVIGGHRIAAVEMIGATEILCDIRDLDEDEALGLELDENLARHELDELDFGTFCIERKALDERMAERQREGGDRRSDAARSRRQVGEVVPRFTKELADRIGRGERTVQRAIATVKALDPDTIALVRGTPLANNASKLQELGREKNAIKRLNLATAMLNGAPTVAAARVAIGDEPAPVDNPQAFALFKLHQAWASADIATRKSFLRDVDAAFLSEPAPPVDAAAERPVKGRKPGKAAR